MTKRQWRVAYQSVCRYNGNAENWNRLAFFIGRDKGIIRLISWHRHGRFRDTRTSRDVDVLVGHATHNQMPRVKLELKLDVTYKEMDFAVIGYDIPRCVNQKVEIICAFRI